MPAYTGFAGLDMKAYWNNHKGCIYTLGSESFTFLGHIQAISWDETKPILPKRTNRWFTDTFEGYILLYSFDREVILKSQYYQDRRHRPWKSTSSLDVKIIGPQTESLVHKLSVNVLECPELVEPGKIYPITLNEERLDLTRPTATVAQKEEDRDPFDLLKKLL